MYIANIVTFSYLVMLYILTTYFIFIAKLINLLFSLALLPDVLILVK